MAVRTAGAGTDWLCGLCNCAAEILDAVVEVVLGASERAAVLCQLSDLKAFLDARQRGSTAARTLGNNQTEEVVPPRAVGPAESAPEGREEQFEEEEDFEVDLAVSSSSEELEDRVKRVRRR